MQLGHAATPEDPAKANPSRRSRRRGPPWAGSSIGPGRDRPDKIGDILDASEAWEREAEMKEALINDPEHWRSRAEEARAIAGDLKDPETRRIMLEIAKGYDRLAEHAELNMLTRSPRGDRDRTSSI